MIKRASVSGVALVLLLCSVGPARASEASDAAEAKRYYEQGTKLFNLGEFQRAIDAYKKAYEIKDDPLLLFNIGQAYRLANDPERAIFFYRSYVRNAPRAKNRAEVEDRIRALEKQLEDGKKGAGAAVPPAPAAPAAPAATGPAAASAPAPAPVTAGAPVQPLGGLPAQSTTASVSPAVAPAPPAPAPVVVTQQLPAAAEHRSEPRPFYARWWFWTAVGVVAAGAGVALVATRGGGGSSPPASTLGTFKIF